jgi:hypothetical protein
MSLAASGILGVQSENVLLSLLRLELDTGLFENNSNTSFSNAALRVESTLASLTLRDIYF